MQDIHRYNEKTSLIDKIEFTILGNKEIKNMSVLDKNTPGLVIPDLYDNTEPKKGGLIDQRMGITSNDLDCSTCGFSTNYCPGHFGHMDLAEPVYHMGFYDYLIKILRCVCPRCSKLLVYKNEDELMELLKNKRGKNRLIELKNLVKTVTYCQKQNYGCGAPIPKIKPDIRKSTAIINIIAEYQTTNTTEENPDKKPTRENLTPEIVYNILKNISNKDCAIMGLDPKKNRPEDLIYTTFPVPPVPVRPSVRGDFLASSTREDHLTIKLADILKANIRIIKHKENMNENTVKYFQDHISYLQFHVATYYDNESLNLPQSEQKGMVTKSLASRLKGKEGRIRNNLMGKRTDFSARTVITPDPTLSVNELGVPIAIATNITFPEIVTPYNIDYLSKLIRNGRDNYPGANFVIPVSIGDTQSKLPIDLRFRKEKIELRYGDIVERHMINGDIVLLNRQPTLHKQSMMGHRCRIIDNPNYCTFRLNPNVTTPYNADFDGDEMNIFCPQSIQAQIELEQIADVKLQIITPQSSAPIIGIVQDGLLGSYNLTIDSEIIDWRSMMNMLTSTDIEDLGKFKKNRTYTGKEVYSNIIPKKINLHKRDGDRVIIDVKNGEIIEGNLDVNSIGVKKKNNLIQLIWDEYGVEETKKFIDNTTRLSNNFNLYHGFTVGIGDLNITEDIYKKMYQIFETKKLEVRHEITEVENNPDMMDEELFERSVKQKLDIIRDDISKLIMNNMKPTNNFKIMIDSGSKGKPIQIGQMGGCVGQQDFQGGRIPKNFNNRSLSYFFKNDDRAESRGFIEQSFLKGLNLTEFIFHHLTSREGLIDQTVKSVTADTLITIIENSKPKIIKIGDWIDAHLLNAQLHNPDLIHKEQKQNFELLNVKDIYIPTLDSDGKVTWGAVTALTRHDPNNHIYEITTKAGRKVKVPESKSLLIWNHQINKFEEKLTLQVKLGDKVPIMMKLSEPPNIIKDVNISDYDKLILNKQNGLFIGLFVANGEISLEENYIKFINNSDSVLQFIKEYFESNNIKYNCVKKENKFTTDIYGYSNKLVNFINKFIIWFESEKQFPDIAITAPIEFIIGLIDGYISSNGIIKNNSIEFISYSEKFIDTFTMLLSRLDIFSTKSVVFDSKQSTTIMLTIHNQWIKIFNKHIHALINDQSNAKINTIVLNMNDNNDYNDDNDDNDYKEQNDVILDEIISINKIDVTDYQKLYDMTVPSTSNFIITSGLGVYDTAESGYIQRKLVKSTEDFMIKYDGTVRNAVERIQQFIYGDSGIDTVRQYDYKFSIMEMSNTEIANKFKFTKDELKKFSNYTEKDNEEYYKNILKIRDHLRRTQIKASVNYLALNISYMLPVNMNRIINNTKNSQDSSHIILNDPVYIIKTIENILQTNKSRLYSMTEDEMNNPNSVKNADDLLSKTAFRYALYDSLAPRKCIQNYKLSKNQLDEIANKIITSFNKAVVEPGEMVGIIGAQSLGEPVTQMMLNSFHNSGVGGMGGANLGVPRIKEVLSLSKNPKEPVMIIYMDSNHRDKKDYVNKIASHIKFTTIKDLRNKIEIFYDPNPYQKDGFMDSDNVYNIFYAFQQSKTCCLNKIDGLPWLMRIEFDKEKLLTKEVSLLDIKSQYCVEWEKRYLDIKSLKREKRYILEKITQLAILTNTDNDNVPIMHIRFDMTNFNSTTLVDFMDMFVDDFKLKGMPDIDDIRGGSATEERMISFDNPDQSFDKLTEYVIYTRGINMISIRNIIGIDLNRTYCNDIITTYEMFGIEAARNLIIREIVSVFACNGSAVNYQHISIFGDLMTNVGTLTSIDRHGINKLDTDPFSRASFEKTVEQLVTAAIFNEIDHMKSVSSRIMAGLCIKGGTGLCNLILDKELLENSEYTVDIGQLYNKTYEDIIPQSKQEVDTEVFIPDF